MFTVMVNVVGPIFLIIGAAALVGRRFEIDIRPISTMIIYLFAPCLVLDGIANSELQARELGQIAALVVSLTVVMALTGWMASRAFKFDRRLTSAFIVSVILVNAANYGIPLNVFAFGEAARQRAVVYYVVTATVVVTFSIFVASRGSVSGRQALANVFKVPVTYAGFIALVINFGDLTLPLPLQRAISILGTGTVPAMLVVLGLQLTRMRVQTRWGVILLAAAFRLVLAPLVAVALAALLGLSGLTHDVSIVESSTPSAVMSGVIATEFGSDAEFATAVILVSTLASILTLSVLITLLGD
jgi:predicted permease